MSIEQPRFVERDGKKVLQVGKIVQIVESVKPDGSGEFAVSGIIREELRWEDVPLTVE